MRVFLALVLVALAAAGDRVWAKEQVSLPLFSPDFNKVVDTLLVLSRAVLKQQGLDQVALPDFSETFRRRAGPVSVTGTFDGYSGWVKSLTSITRTGNATATWQWQSSKFVIDVPIGFSDLEAGYSYKAQMSKIKTSGHVVALVESNSLSLQASLAISLSGCSMGVDSLDLVELGAIKIKEATGFGPLNFLLRKVGNWAAKRAHVKIEDETRNALKDAIDKAGLRFTCS